MRLYFPPIRHLPHRLHNHHKKQTSQTLDIANQPGYLADMFRVSGAEILALV